MSGREDMEAVLQASNLLNLLGNSLKFQIVWGYMWFAKAKKNPLQVPKLP